MTVYATMENDKMTKLFRGPADACRYADYLADKKEEELRGKDADGMEYTVTRKENRIIVDDHYDHDYDEVWNYWMKSVDVLNKFEC